MFTRISEHVADYRAAASARLPAQLDEGVVGAEGGIRDYKIEVTGTFTNAYQDK